MFLVKDNLFIGFLFQTNSLMNSVRLKVTLYRWEKEMEEGGTMHSAVVLGNATTCAT